MPAEITPSSRSAGLGPAKRPVPPEQGLGLHEEPSATRAIKQSTDPGGQCPIRRAQDGLDRLATEDGHLVAEHDLLDGQLVAVTSTQSHQLDEADKGEVQERKLLQ